MTAAPAVGDVDARRGQLGRPTAGRDVNPRAASAVATGLAAFVAAMSVLLMASWWSGNPQWARAGPGDPSTKLNTAVALLLLAASLGVLAARPSARRCLVADAFAGAALVVAAATLAEYVAGVDLGIDQLFAPDPGSPLTTHPGRMSPTTAVAVVLLAVAALGRNRGTGGRVARSVALVALASVAYGVLLTFLVGVQETALGGSLVAGVSAYTLLGVVALGLGFALVPEPSGLVTRFVGASMSGRLARRILPSTLFIPAFMAVAFVQGIERGYFGSGFAAAGWGVCTTLVLGAVTWATLRSVDVAEAGRAAAVDALRGERDRLEERVARRTADLAERDGFQRAILKAESSLGEAICVVDGSRIAYANDAFCSFFGRRGTGDDGAAGARDTLRRLRAARRNASPGTEARGSLPPLIEVKAPDGATRHLEVATSALVEYPDRELIVARDVTDEVASREALRESEARFRSATEHSAIGMAIVSLDGRFLEVNQALADIVGYAPDEVKKLTFQDVTHPDDLEADLAQARRLEAGDIASYSIEKRYVRKDGEAVWVLLTGSAVRGDDGDPLYFIAQVQDVTARKNAERRLAAQGGIAGRLAEARSVDGAAEGVLEVFRGTFGWDAAEFWRMDRREQVLRISQGSYSDQAAAAGFGVAAEGVAFERGRGLPGRVWAAGEAMVVPDVTTDPDFVRREAAARAGLRSGMGFPVKVGSRIVGVMAFFGRDANAFDDELRGMMNSVGHQVGESIQRVEAEEMVRTVLEAAPDATVASDREGRIVLFNARAERAFGYARGEVVGRSVDLLVAEEDADAHATHHRRLFEGTVGRASDAVLQVRARRRDGTLFPVEVGCSIVQGPHAPLAVASVRDVTDREAARRELAQKTAELERSNADLEQFAYVASHDLQEPLRMVTSYCELLDARYRDSLDAKGRTYLGFAVDGARRMQDMIRDLLEYSRVGTRGKPFVEVDVSEVAATAVRDLQAAIVEAGATVTIADLPHVRADPGQLHALFLNLIGNALKFRRSDVTPRVDVDAVRGEGDEWLFRVQDNGIGIESRFLDRLFVPFRRLHPRSRYPGTGMGLSICRRIVERRGGRIRVESVPGEGSTFTFTVPDALPSTAEATVDPAERSATEEGRPSGTG